FTLLGLEKGLAYDLHPFLALVMGMVSAVFGGVLRDVLTRKVPLIFKKEIYASACLAGGVTYLILANFKINENLHFIVSAAVIFIIRSIAVKYKLELPKVKIDVLGEPN
ncbi:trimeric intracellular cation channel family protein, partial [Tenacibaculum piscium]